MVIAPPPLVSFKALALTVRNGAPAQTFDWALGPGEQWAIIGPTACGKSLLARAVAGEGPFAEKGVWSSELGTHRSQVPGHVAYVAFDGRPQGEALFHQARWHAQTTEDAPTLDTYLSIHNIWRRNPFEVREAWPPEAATVFQAHRARIIADLELAPLLQRRLHQLSDGEWRRAQIGRALLRAPRLLVLDDPFTGLDKGFRARLRDVLAHLMQTGTHLLLVVPDPEDLPDGITHLLVLDGHGGVHAGPLDAVLGKSEGALRLARCGRGEQIAQAVGNAGASLQPLPAPPVIRMQAVSVTHSEMAVLRDVSWTVWGGERWALVGPNGAGKSTLLSLILGDHPQAYANNIELFGRRRGSGESIWEIKRRIGWVAPELHRYFPVEVTTADLVASGFFDTLGLSRACDAVQQARVRQWLARFELSDLAARPFRTLSKGEQRLALIARALVKSPELLVLDEPCQGLDVVHVDRVLQALGELVVPGAEGSELPAMIYVTHRPAEFPRNLTHLLELNQGRVVRQGALTP
jgi:molybdate transport system ATP-binding protein